MKLGNFINIINGYAFNSNEFTNNINEYPVIKIKELKNNRILLNKDTCYIQYNNNLCNFVLKEGDIVIALTGNPPTKGSIDAMVGRCCRYNLPFPAFMNQRVCKVYSTSDKLLNKYLYYYLSLEDTILNLAQRCSGSANQANISSNDIKDLDITLPNLETQHHIVNINERRLNYV